MFCTSARCAALLFAFTMGLAVPDARAAEYANSHLVTSVAGLVKVIENEDKKTWLGGQKELRIVDLRPRGAFREGHIPGAVNIPFTSLTDPESAIAGALKSDSELAALLAGNGISQSSRVVLYDDEGGFRASRLFWLLEYFGHRRVSMLNGGVQAWTRAGRELAKPKKRNMADIAAEMASAAVAKFAVTRTPRRYASADYILSHRADKHTVVIDVRPNEVFEDGHIPWAKNLPWTQNLTEDMMLKPADELLARFAGHGITPDRNIVIHCQTGEASSHSYFTLRVLGFPRVRTYHRSWAEWGASDDLPKAKP